MTQELNPLSLLLLPGGRRAWRAGSLGSSCIEKTVAASSGTEASGIAPYPRPQSPEVLVMLFVVEFRDEMGWDLTGMWCQKDHPLQLPGELVSWGTGLRSLKITINSGRTLDPSGRWQFQVLSLAW